MADGDENEPVTRAEFTSALEELRQATQELRDARTPEERQEARSDIGDAEDELTKAAKALGLSRDQLAKAASDARTAQRREELRPLVAELWDERQREEAERVQREADEAAAAAAAAGGDKGKTKPKAKPADDKSKSGDADDDGDKGGDPPTTTRDRLLSIGQSVASGR
jgi:hypothetical protein